MPVAHPVGLYKATGDGSGAGGYLDDADNWHRTHTYT